MTAQPKQLYRRIKATAVFAPPIYQREAVRAEGYKPATDARFGVVRVDADAPWQLVHLASGGACESLLPTNCRKLTMTDKLAVAAAWHEAVTLDWSAFDALPQTTLATTDAPMFVLPPPRETVDAMRELARIAIGGC